MRKLRTEQQAAMLQGGFALTNKGDIISRQAAAAAAAASERLHSLTQGFGS